MELAVVHNRPLSQAPLKTPMAARSNLYEKMKGDDVPLLKRSNLIHLPRKTKAPVIRQAFLNVSMSKQHLGLQKVASTKKINLSLLQDGEFVLFLNRKRDKIKLYGPDNAFIYVRAPENGCITAEFLQSIPKHLCGGAAFTYDNVMRSALEMLLDIRPKEEDETDEE